MANNITKWQEKTPPRSLLAIDPGWSDAATKKKTGIQVPYVGAALFVDATLIWAAVIKCLTVVPPYQRPFALVKKVCQEAHIQRFFYDGLVEDPGFKLNMLVVEQPILYKKGTARPEDIINLRTVYGAFMGGIESEFYSGPTPSTWKGSIDGIILNERVANALDYAEQLILIKAQQSGAGGLTDHVFDACGLGLFTLGRTDVAGVKM